MTTHSRADLDRLAALARAKFEHAHMSDTKWRKLFATLNDAGLGLLQVMMKFIDHPEPRLMSCPHRDALHTPWPYVDTLEFGPIELRSIEWMDIPATARFPRPNGAPTREVQQNVSLAVEIADRLGCKVLACPEGLRILGYSGGANSESS